MEEYAVKITHQPVIGLSAPTLFISTSMSSLSSFAFLYSSPTTCTYCDSKYIYLLNTTTITTINSGEHQSTKSVASIY